MGILCLRLFQRTWTMTANWNIRKIESRIYEYNKIVRQNRWNSKKKLIYAIFPGPWRSNGGWEGLRWWNWINKTTTYDKNCKISCKNRLLIYVSTSSGYPGLWRPTERQEKLRKRFNLYNKKWWNISKKKSWIMQYFPDHEGKLGDEKKCDC